MSTTLLTRAHEERLSRGEEAALMATGAMVDELCDALELDVNVPNYTLVGPDARKKLAGLINYYRRSAHPFTQCVRDNRKRFGPRVNDVCGVMTDLVKGTTHWRKGGKKKTSTALALSQDSSISLDLSEADDETVALLSAIARTDYSYVTGTALPGESFAALTSKQRGKLPASDFVFPKTRSYPYPDEEHGSLAIDRSKGKPEEAEVKAAVCKRYSTLPACQPTKGSS